MILSLSDNYSNSCRDAQNRDIVYAETKHGMKQKDRSDAKINIWLAGAIIFFLATVFVIAGFVIREAYLKPPAARTALERELFKFEDLVKNNPNSPDAHIGLAGVFLQLDRPDKAIQELETANDLDPYSWNSLFGLGMAHEAMNNKQRAVFYYKQAADMKPANELAFFKLGNVYLSQNLYEEAIASYEKALSINPTLADAHYYLGLCYEKTNKNDLAIDQYREALQYVDKYPEATRAMRRLQ